MKGKIGIVKPDEGVVPVEMKVVGLVWAWGLQVQKGKLLWGAEASA